MATRRLFLSYTTDDRSWADQLRAGAKTFAPDVDIVDYPVMASPGENWQDLGGQLLKSSDGIVCLVGARTSQSKPVDWELRTAAALGKPSVVIQLAASRDDGPAAVRELGIPTFVWSERVRALENLTSRIGR
jgi:hypothetical protein